MLMILSEKQTIESRIREIKRGLLHQKSKGTREIWREHIKYLETQI